jgi:hypothetical protein
VVARSVEFTHGLGPQCLVMLDLLEMGSPLNSCFETLLSSYITVRDVCFRRPSLESREPSLQLVDMGRGIDMTLFPKGTTFDTVVTTRDFQCIEMQTKRPWTYQVTLIRSVLINYHNTERKITTNFLCSPPLLIDHAPSFVLSSQIPLSSFISSA